MNFDIVIIGFGPAGAALAKLLDPKFKIAVIDRKTDARGGWQKACGGLLAPDAQEALARFALTLPKEILVDPQIFSVKTLDLKSKLIRHYQRFYINMDRAGFDAWLASLAPQGVNVFKGGLCKEIKPAGGGFEIVFDHEDEKKILKTKYIVGADGADSFVRKTFFPHRKIRRYTAVQQWFKEENPRPFYACIFDAENTDCYSWGISKDGYFIFGGAYPVENSAKHFENQKEKLKNSGFNFGPVLKTEACVVLRPSKWGDFCTGSGNIFLIGEAAGFISASSLEGISSALNSAYYLAEAFNSSAEVQKTYRRKTFMLRLKLYFKIFKVPFIYRPFLRKLIMKSGLKSIKIKY